MFRGAQQTCLGPHHLKVSQGRLASPGCVHWSLLSPEPREKIRAVSHRSTRHALSSAWNTVSVTQPRLSLHSLVHTMDLSLHSSIYLDGSILFWAWNGSYAFPFTALYNTTQHNTPVSSELCTHEGSILSDLSSQSLSHTERPVSLYTEWTVHWWPCPCDKLFPRSLTHT